MEFPRVRLLGPRLSPNILAEWVTLFTNMVSSITYMRKMFKFIPSLTQIVLVMLYVPCSIYLAVSRIYRLGCSIIGWSWIKRKLDFLLLNPPPLQFLATSYSLSWWSWDSLFAFFSRLFATWVSFLTTSWPRSINWQLRNLNRIRKFLDTDTCHNIVRILILSKLDYFNSLLYGIDIKHLNRLQVLQNKYARLILKQPSRTLLSYSPSIGSQSRREFLSSSLSRLSKLSNLVLLVICLHIFHKTKYSLRSDLAITFEVPRAKKQAGDRAFSVAGPHLWNGLPSRVHTVGHMDRFKNKLKSRSGAIGGQKPPKDFKKGKMNKYVVFSCIKVIKIGSSVIFNEEIRALEGLLSRF